MGPNPFQYLKDWIISLFPLRWDITNTGRLPHSSPWKAKLYTMMSNTKDVYCRAECEHIKKAQLHGRSLQPLTEAALRTDLRHNEWVSSYTHLWAHSGERQQQEDDNCLRETIFPIPNFMGHTLSPVMVWAEEFFPYTHRPLCSNKFGAFFLHPLLKGARNL